MRPCTFEDKKRGLPCERGGGHEEPHLVAGVEHPRRLGQAAGCRLYDCTGGQRKPIGDRVWLTDGADGEIAERNRDLVRLTMRWIPDRSRDPVIPTPDAATWADWCAG